MKKRISIQGMRLNALVFDMDGLIFDSERIVQRAWTKASQELGLPDVGAHIYNTIGFNAGRREIYFYQTFGADFPAADFAVTTRRCFKAIAEAEGVPVKPGAVELLQLAKELGVKTALATSSRKAHAVEMLEQAEIYRYFDGAIYGDEVRNAKPDPEIYQKAGQLLKADPAGCIALEDAPAGIQAAYAAGMHPVMIPDLVAPDRETLAKCWRCYETLKDVVDLIRSSTFLPAAGCSAGQD